MINPMKLMQMKEAWGTFKKNHPKFPNFLNAAMKNGMEEGTIIEITVKTVDGKELGSNIRINRSDLELVESLKELINS